MYGFSTLPSVRAAILIAVGLAGLSFFIVYEQRISHPLLDIGLFRRNTVFAFSNLAALINYAATFAVGFVLSLYLQNLKGLSPTDTGLVLMAQPIVQTLFSPLAGRLSDTVASTGMAICLVGLVCLMFIDASSSLTFIVVCLAVLGLGFALFTSPNTNAVMSSIERHHIGVAGAVVSMVRQIGMMFSMGILMMLMTIFLGQSTLEAAVYGSFVTCSRVTFGVFAALCLAGIFASLARGKMRGGDSAGSV
jgi:predicted MFS family arabinose efflux permease